MAGEGSRFREQGFDQPKYRIEIDGEPMFRWALRSLTDFFDDHFVFLTREEYRDETFVSDQCEKLGVSDYDIRSIAGLTDGQATTALAAEELVPETNTTAIYNIDTYIEETKLKADQVGSGHCMPVFRPEGDHWSFVRMDSGTVSEVREKERISPLATVGFYQFESWHRFEAAYRSKKDRVKSEFGEVYVAPLYNWLVDSGDAIGVVEVDTGSVHPLGTPTDVSKFAPQFA
jgi:dTDP-glucose pyrophosphorylase